MAKGLIVVEVPERCVNCPIGENVSNPLEACVICQMAPKGVNPCRINDEIEGKPDWCPIHPMPERIKQVPLSDINYKRGWNDCIDYICATEGRKGDRHG